MLDFRIEHSAVDLDNSIQQGGLPAKASCLAPTLIEVGTLFFKHFIKIVKSQFSIWYTMCFWVCQSGKAFTTKGTHVLKLVGRETMDLLAIETDFEIEKDDKETEKDGREEMFSEESTFDQCFWFMEDLSNLR